MKKTILAVVMTCLSVIAAASVAGACLIWGYQPRVPRCLNR
jgi:cyclic lactone autoinducer peptide